MEDSKKVYKFFGKPGEDFRLWEARTEAALEAKEALHVVTTDVMSGNEDPSQEVLKEVTTARAIVIQRLGDRPLRLCLSEKANPFRMWARLRDRYAVKNTDTRVQLQSRLSRMIYQGQSMPDYVDAYEEIFNRLAAMQSPIDEDMQIAMLLASFRDKSQSSYGHFVASLQTVTDSPTWETVTARLLQENEEQSAGGKLIKVPKSEHSQALTADSTTVRPRRQFSRKKISPVKVERRRCYNCNKIGHLAKNCRQKLRQRNAGSPSDAADSVQDCHSASANEAGLLAAVSDSLSCQNLDECHVPATTNDFDSSSDEISISCFNCLTPRSDSGAMFLLDSGASDHMVVQREWLRDVRLSPTGESCWEME